MPRRTNNSKRRNIQRRTGRRTRRRAQMIEDNSYAMSLTMPLVNRRRTTVNPFTGTDEYVLPSARPHTFPQTILLERFNVSTASIGKTYFLSLALCPNGNSFAAIYKQWRIISCEVYFYAHANTSSLDVSTSSGVGFYGVVEDPTISTAPTSMDELRQYSDLKYQPSYATVNKPFRPTVSFDAIITGTGTGQSQKVSPWLSVTNPDVRHYGLRCFFEDNNGGGTGEAYTFDVQAKVIFQFKTVA